MEETEWTRAQRSWEHGFKEKKEILKMNKRGGKWIRKTSWNGKNRQGTGH